METQAEIDKHMEQESKSLSKKINKRKLKKEVLYFLYQNINKKFSVSQIWEEIAGKYDVSYERVQNIVLWLQYQKDIKIEWRHPYKLVWIEAGDKLT